MTDPQQTAYLNAIHGTSTTLGPSTNTNQPGTSAGTVGSTTACGHGDHPHDHANDTGVVLPTCRYGPQQEDLDGEQQMADAGEGKVMDEQLEKKHAGWGGEDSLTEGLERKKKEQAEMRHTLEDERRRGRDVDGGGVVRTADEDTSAV
ncbi:hypothetical protein ACLOAV_007712 [Pseudogymnoascus australis]